MNSLRKKINIDIKNEMNQSMNKRQMGVTEEHHKILQEQITLEIMIIEKCVRDKESSPHTNLTNTTPQQPISSSTSTTHPQQPNPTNTTNMKTHMFPNGLPIFNVNQPQPLPTQLVFGYPMRL
jgi:hypothetical protein